MRHQADVNLHRHLSSRGRVLTGPESKELGISKWMKVRLTSTLTCTLLYEQKEGRVVAMRLRLTVVLFTELITFFTASSLNKLLGNNDMLWLQVHVPHSLDDRRVLLWPHKHFGPRWQLHWMAIGLQGIPDTCEFIAAQKSIS